MDIIIGITALAIAALLLLRSAVPPDPRVIQITIDPIPPASNGGTLLLLLLAIVLLLALFAGH